MDILVDNKGNIKNIFVDMDGVLVDFEKGISEMIGHPLGNDNYGHSEYDARKKELTDKRCFRKLPPTVDYHELIGYIKHTGINWEILTAAGAINRQLVVWDKNEWIKEYVDPFVVVTCTHSGNQKKIFSKEGNVLIDDRQSNIDAWESEGGIGILHKNARDTINELKRLRSGLKVVESEVENA